MKFRLPGALCFILGTFLCVAADQTQWGQPWSRNLVSAEKKLADFFDPKSGVNVKWSAELGTETYSTPIIADGRVYIGTNNEHPRDLKHEGDRGVLLCLDEKTGKLLWQLVVPKREDTPYSDWPKSGICSPPSIEGDRLYFVNNRGEVMCLDARGLANGNDGPFKDEASHMTPRGTNAPAQTLQPGPTDGDILWLFDLTAGAGITSHDAAHCSILIHGNYLYVNTSTGVDDTHKIILAPNAPSLVVIDKRTGKFVARDDEKIAPDIFHCTWSSPALARIGKQETVVFCGGNGVVYGFDPVKKVNSTPAALKRLWRIDFDPTAPKEDIHKYSTNRRESPSNIYGMPVVQDGKVYVAGGGDIFWGKREAWLKCFDPAKVGTTNEVVWSYPLQKHVMGTPAIYAGCVFIADCGRTMHCVDAATGKNYWTHEIRGDVWASCYVADGKVYLGTRSGDFWIFAASKEKKVINKIEIGTPMSGTTTAANGVIYIATASRLYAIEETKAINGKKAASTLREKSSERVR